MVAIQEAAVGENTRAEERKCGKSKVGMCGTSCEQKNTKRGEGD